MNSGQETLSSSLFSARKAAGKPPGQPKGPCKSKLDPHRPTCRSHDIAGLKLREGCSFKRLRRPKAALSFLSPLSGSGDPSTNPVSVIGNKALQSDCQALLRCKFGGFGLGIYHFYTYDAKALWFRLLVAFRLCADSAHAGSGMESPDFVGAIGLDSVLWRMLQQQDFIGGLECPHL